MTKANWKHYAVDDERAELEKLDRCESIKRQTIRTEIHAKRELIRRRCIKRMRRANGKN